MRFLFLFSFLILFFSCSSEPEIDLSNIGNYPKANIDYYSDPETKAKFDAYIADRLKNRNLPPFRYAAFTVYLYVITEGHLAVPADFDLKILKHMYEGWSIISVNPILSQLGVWIQEAKICRINSIYDLPDAFDSGDFTNGALIPGNQKRLDSWIFQDKKNYNLTTAASEDGTYGCPTRTGGQPVIATTDQFRILWHRAVTGINYSISRFAVLINRMNHDHGRNIIAHEIGHNFSLSHANNTYESPCSRSVDTTRIMSSTSFKVAKKFAPCEIILAQANIACYIDGGPCVQYPSTTVTIKEPPKDRFNEGLTYLLEKFVPIGCRQTFNFDMSTNRKPLLKNEERMTNIDENDRLPEKYCDLVEEPTSTLRGRGIGKQYELNNEESKKLATKWLNDNIPRPPRKEFISGDESDRIRGLKNQLWESYCWGSWYGVEDTRLEKARCRYAYNYSLGGNFSANNDGCDYRLVDRLQRANGFPIYFTGVDNAKCIAPALPAR